MIDRWWTALAATLCVAGSAAPAAELQPFLARYSFAWGSITVGEATAQLERTADRKWKYTSSTAPRGFGRLFRSRPIVNESVMEETSAGIRPLRYSAEDGSDSTERDQQFRFDWEHHRATGTSGGHAIDMPIPDGTQDDLSVQVALMHELIAGRVPTSFRMFDERGVREYRYVHEGSATLVTPLGSVQTEIYRSQRDGAPRATRFWCAPEWGYLPMKVEQRRKERVEWTMEILSAQR
jgi:hypothetical protein